MMRRQLVLGTVFAIATLVLLPGVAAAQSPAPTVAGVVIEQPPPQVLGETLPRTGSDLMPMLVVAITLVVIGALLVVGVRRRRSSIQPA